MTALIAAALVGAVFWVGWYCGSDSALTVAAKANQDAMRILGVDWDRYIEAIKKATTR